MSLTALALTGVFIAPVIFARYGPRLALAELRASWKSVLAVGVLHMLAYILVLRVYSMSRVTYAGALRESSVVFAALAGWLWLGEGFGLQRTLGAALVFAGIVLISVAG